MSQEVLSVSQVNEYIKFVLDNDDFLSGIAIRGEISNYKVYPSGHHYFTLKDNDAALKCVMFRGNAVRLRFRPENGMQIIALGKISAYPRDGAYQLYCTSMVTDGVGDLHAAFEQLKAKLSAQGLFDEAHKKPLPQYPETIGIITSSAGAAVHDILRILNKRYPLCKVKLLPVRVQGVEAPEEISAAINYANACKLADLLIVGRGGGSVEDLWAFNDERVAHAIYRSAIPVISAVGHEPDVTISDYVADLRAATPSNAAELAVPDQDMLRQMLDGMLNTMTVELNRQLTHSREQVRMLADRSLLRNPQNYLQLKAAQLTSLYRDLQAVYRQTLNAYKQPFFSLTSKLDTLSPLKVLSRGYSIVQTGEGDTVRSARQIRTGDNICITLHDGSVSASVTQIKEDRYEQKES